MSPVGRNLTDGVDVISKGTRYLSHDRDPLFTLEFVKVLGEAGLTPIKLPLRSLNVNAYAKRFVRTINESCLSACSSSARARFGEPSPNSTTH
jgi:putative transposase